MAGDDGPVLRITARYRRPPSEISPLLIGELTSSLRRQGWRLDSRKGRTLRHIGSGRAIGDSARIVRGRSAHRIAFIWADGSPRSPGVRNLEVSLDADGPGTLLSVDYRGGSDPVGDAGDDRSLGWFVSEVLGPLISATSPQRLEDWRADRDVRRPSGAASRARYADPIYHQPNFAAILHGLALGRDDRLLEVGCGGGSFLKQALRSGCEAAAIDHSADLLGVAAHQNSQAVRSGRLRLVYADATRLPFSDGQFTCAVMTGVLGFLPDPVAVLREMGRTLAPKGRIAVYNGTKKMYGTPAAGPKRPGGVRLYEDRELARFAERAGLTGVRIEHPDLTPFAKKVGIPEDSMYLFTPEFNHILWATAPDGPGRAR
jgi:SAM-dependent methyltransferase